MPKWEDHGYHIDPELKANIFQTIEMMRPGDSISDYMNERVAYIYYTFDSREEIDKIASKLNQLAYVEYE